jgi:hypothetical protein
VVSSLLDGQVVDVTPVPKEVEGSVHAASAHVVGELVITAATM